MVREHITRLRCDVCSDQATHEKVTITIGGAVRGRTLDLCDRDYRELIQPLLNALASVRPYSSSGNRSRQWAGRSIGPFLCRAGCVSGLLKNLTTLDAHLKGIHGMTRAEYIELYGEPVPLTPEEQEALVVEVACQVKGCGKIYSTALGHRWPQQALRGHMWGVHAIRWRPTDPAIGSVETGSA